MYIKGRFINQQQNNMWKQWLNFILGLWIVLSAYLGFTPDAMVTNLTVTGIIMAGLSLWSALEYSRMTRMDSDHIHSHA